MLKTGQKAIGIDDFIEHYTFEPNIGIDPAAIAHSWRKSMVNLGYNVMHQKFIIVLRALRNLY